MLKQLKTFSLKKNILFLILGLFIMFPSGFVTEGKFSKVNYPGADFGGVPLTFDTNQKHQNLLELQRLETIDLFIEVQFFDLGIIVGTLLLFTSLSLIILKGLGWSRFFSLLGNFALLLFLLAPCMDLLENITLLILVYGVETGPLDIISILNSLFTLGKKGFFYGGWIISAINLLGIVFHRLLTLFR